MKKVLVIHGTARKGNESEKVSQFVLNVAKTRTDFEPVYLEVEKFLHLRTGDMSPEQQAEWSTLAKEASGYVIVSPEYNHGYPGELKQLLDACFAEYKWKPFGIVGISSGPVGGARMIEQLKGVINTLYGIPVRSNVHFGIVQSLFDENGKIRDEGAWTDKLMKLFDEVSLFLK